jgi:hypothetical protein
LHYHLSTLSITSTKRTFRSILVSLSTERVYLVWVSKEENTGVMQKAMQKKPSMHCARLLGAGLLQIMTGLIEI